MKFIKYFFQALIVYVFFFIIKLIGLNNSRKIFSFIFKKLGPMIKSEDIVNTNLNIISKFYKGSKSKDKILSDMWSNYGKVFVEYIYLHKFKNKSFKTEQLRIDGKEILEEIAREGKPVIFISAHLANFELMSMEITRQNINLATIYRPLNNIFLNFFMEYLRKKYICTNQIKKGLAGTRQAIYFLKKNYSIALMIDQRVSEGKLLPFFNKNALTTTIPAQLALKYDCNIVPIYIKRDDNNFFEIKIYKPIETKHIENNEKNKIEISLKLNNLVEEMIVRDPAQWILTHNRWK